MFSVTTANGQTMILKNAGKDAHGNQLWQQVPVETRITCELCGRTGSQRFVKDEIGWRCSNLDRCDFRRNRLYRQRAVEMRKEQRRKLGYR